MLASFPGLLTYHHLVLWARPSPRVRVWPARLTIACSYVKTDAASDQKLDDGKAWEGADWSHSQAKVGGMGMRLYSGKAWEQGYKDIL